MKSLGHTSVAILGPAIDHQQSLMELLSGRVGCLTVLPDSHSYGQGRLNGLASRLTRSIDQLSHTHNAEYLDLVCQKLDASRADVVIGYWGTNPLPDLLAIKKLRPSVKLVLMVLCYPLTLNDVGLVRQQWMMRRAATQLDGFLFPSSAMADFFQRTIFRRSDLHWTVLSPCWPATFLAEHRAPPASNLPNLMFIGRTDLSHQTVHAADDIRPLMGALLDAGIELNHVWSKETDDGHAKRRPFKPLAQKELIATMSCHDASLIVYNTEACTRDERFRFTVPDRLITSVAAGVPIAIPTVGYDGSKSYLASYPAVITFGSAADLFEQLSDRSNVAALKEAAWLARKHYSAQCVAPQLQSFLEKLLAS